MQGKAEQAGSGDGAESHWEAPGAAQEVNAASAPKRTIRPGRLTFEVEVGTAAQKDVSCPREPQLSHLEQRVAHALLVEWRVGLLLQQLAEDMEPALLTGDVTGPGR